MIIIGAGMAGLLAANYFRKKNPVILEKQPSLPNNHGALLRFRSDKAFKVAGLQGRKVEVRKAVVFGSDFMVGPNPYLANMYSFKVTGQVSDRSIWNLDTVTRYIAQDDFIAKLAEGCQINFDYDINFGNDEKPFVWGKSEPIISTIPMPALMHQLKWQNCHVIKSMPTFESRSIWTITAHIPWVDVNQTIYFPEMDVPYYRASFVGPQFIIELIRDPGDEVLNIFEEVIDYFGVSAKMSVIDMSAKKQSLGKILPIDDSIRKEFMHWATEKFNIYSLGRFATWRQILLDDVVDDLQVIERMMTSKYTSSLIKSSKVE